MTYGLHIRMDEMSSLWTLKGKKIVRIRLTLFYIHLRRLMSHFFSETNLDSIYKDAYRVQFLFKGLLKDESLTQNFLS